MSHPENKRDRFLLGMYKGISRARGLSRIRTISPDPRPGESFVRESYRHRDTTKTCGCVMCQNPRRAYNKKTIQERRILSNDFQHC